LTICLSAYRESTEFDIKIDSSSVNSEYDELCNQLSKLGFIDVAAGIAAAGGIETYISVCDNFCETSSTRMQMISDYFNAKDWLIISSYEFEM